MYTYTYLYMCVHVGMCVCMYVLWTEEEMAGYIAKEVWTEEGRQMKEGETQGVRKG